MSQVQVVASRPIEDWQPPSRVNLHHVGNFHQRQQATATSSLLRQQTTTTYQAATAASLQSKKILEKTSSTKRSKFASKPEEVKSACRLLKNQQAVLLSQAKEKARGSNERASAHLLCAYTKLSVKWFDKMADGSQLSFEIQKVERQIQQTIEVLSNFLKEWRMDHLLLPALIYVERYFRVLGSISYQYVFDLFLTSVVLAIKFWHDPVISNVTFAKIFDIPTTVLTYNELNFLYAVDYKLVLDEEEIRVFAARLSV